MIPEGWKKCKLTEVVGDIAMGPFGSNLKVDNFIESGIPVIRGSNLNKGGFFKNNFVFVSEEKANSLKRCLAYPDELIFTHRGTLGQVGIIPHNQYPYYLVSQSQMRLSVNKKFLDPKFLYYFFLSSLGQKELLKNSSQVGVPAIANPTKSLKDVNLVLPTLIEQEKIASILSSLDDKIELNLRMNKTLEAMAQAIFKEWFVDFRFPGLDGELVEGLPKGWRRGKVSDICSVNNDLLSSKDEMDDIQYIEISEVNRGVIKNVTRYKRGEEPSRARRKLMHGDIAISTVRPNRGSFFLAFNPENNLIASTGFAVFRAKNVPFSYLYYFLSSEERIDYYGKMADGAAYPAINPSVIMNMDIVIPESDVLTLFQNTVGNLLLHFYENIKENKVTTQIRDLLLPKLLTGKIKVPE